jgi:hypothetical protein
MTAYVREDEVAIPSCTPAQPSAKKTTSVNTTFYFAGIANFLLLFGREEGIKPSPAATNEW